MEEGTMRDFALLAREREGRPGPDLVVVPYGFSLAAAVFQPFWALWHGAWASAVALVLVQVALRLAAAGLGAPAPIFVLVLVAAALIVGLVAHDLRRLELSWRGFRLVDIVAARDADEAEARLIVGWLAGADRNRVETLRVSA
jgi:hypothetical protein